MAKITIEELSGSLKEYLNGLGLTEAQVQGLIDKFEDEKIGDISQLSTEEKESLVGAINEVNQKANKEVDLSNYQQKTDNSLQTSSKDVIGAINELFQSANNGKELIASAIGEPLSSSDTFSAMSNDINGLLSQFKTNMMKNGITIESGDKFKSLIDKIATMVEEGSGKGIQFTRKDITLSKGSKWLQVNDLGFKANIVMYDVDTSHVLYNDTAGYDQLVLYPIGGSVGSAVYSSVSNFPGGMYINENGFRLPIFTAQYTESNTQTTVNKTITYYAIGVGEEDTTLRDSLAGILGDKGIEVSPDDDMASLISKVSLFDDYTPSPLYIVNNGVVNTDFKIIKQSSGYSMTQNSDHILFNIPKGTSNNSMAISTPTKFNLTNYSNIVIRYYTSGGRFNLGINTEQSNSNYNNYVKHLGENQYKQEATYRFNISDYNDEYYIIIDVDNLSAVATSTLKIYDIYLEK